MAKQLKLRFAQPEEAETVVDWLNKHKTVNQYNAETLKSQHLRILCSYDESGPQQYILLNKVLMLDSAAPNPNISPLNAAQSFRDFTKAALLLASAEGIREIYALDLSGELDSMATNHHYELLGKKDEQGNFKPFRVYRITV